MHPHTNSPLDVLVKARDILAKPGAWTQNAEARDVHNNQVQVGSTDAVCFCVVGGLWQAATIIEREAHVYNWGPHVKYARVLLEEYVCSGQPNKASALVLWNDTVGRTQQDVVNVLDEVIVQQRVRGKSET